MTNSHSFCTVFSAKNKIILSQKPPLPKGLFSTFNCHSERSEETYLKQDFIRWWIVKVFFGKLTSFPWKVPHCVQDDRSLQDIHEGNEALGWHLRRVMEMIAGYLKTASTRTRSIDVSTLKKIIEEQIYAVVGVSQPLFAYKWLVRHQPWRGEPDAVLRIKTY